MGIHLHARNSPGIFRPPTHPCGGYEMIFDLLLVAAIWPLRNRLRPNGMFFTPVPGDLFHWQVLPELPQGGVQRILRCVERSPGRGNHSCDFHRAIAGVEGPTGAANNQLVSCHSEA